MTLRIPAPSIGDRILRLLGKKRALILPKGPLEGKGFDVHAYAMKESFWKTFLRSRQTKFPVDAVEYEHFYKKFVEIRQG